MWLMPTRRAVPSIAADATGRNRPARAESDPVDRAVANHALLAERLEYEMVRHARQERPLALFAVEVDRPEAVARGGGRPPPRAARPGHRRPCRRPRALRPRPRDRPLRRD